MDLLFWVCGGWWISLWQIPVAFDDRGVVVVWLLLIVSMVGLIWVWLVGGGGVGFRFG